MPIPLLTRFARIALGPLLGAALLSGALAPAAHAQPTTTAPTASPLAHPACAAPTAPGAMSCTIITTAPAVSSSTRASGPERPAAGGPPAGLLGPTDLQNIYNLQSATSGSRQTVAVIGAGPYNTSADANTPASDLSSYRSHYGLEPCTAGDGCLTVENENGGSTLPTGTPIAGWQAQSALSMDTISAICPNCDILFVEASSSNITDLATAAQTAAQTAGVSVVDNPYAGPESNFTSAASEATLDAFYDNPGVAMIAAAGNSGFTGGINYPAASPDVISVGGTVLSQNAAGLWSDSAAWSGTTSGCSLYENKPAWQADSLCGGRTDNDLSAAAATTASTAPVAYFSDGAWAGGGATALSAGIISGIYALAGTPARRTNPASYPYDNARYDLNDITSGTTGTCAITALCGAGAGYDAPTGLGTPSTTLALTSSGAVSGVVYGASAGSSCLDNSHGNLANNNKIDWWQCNGDTDTQQWTLASDGSIQIGNNSGFCIGVSQGGTTNGSNIILFGCNGGTSQQWATNADDEIVNQKSGKCMADPNGTQGDQLVLEVCNSTAEFQLWRAPYPVPSSTGAISLKSSSGMCLDDKNDVLSYGNTVQIWSCNGGASQKWTVESNGNVQIAAGYCLDYLETVSPPSTVASLGECDLGGTMVWTIHSDGSLAPAAILPNCLLVTGTPANGTQPIPGSCDGSSDEEWNLP